MSAKPIPKFEKRIFWDVDFSKLDYDNKAIINFNAKKYPNQMLLISIP